MDLLNKVKDELQKLGYDFSSDIWSDDLLVILYDAVYTTEKIIKNETDTAG